jgi:hypothetical protein
MQLESFLDHWAIAENPFRAEEARHDPVFARLLERSPAHPDFDKVYGEPDRPSAGIVFGEKGSGKTALRLLMEQRIADHNTANSDRLAWVVRYDDLNPVLERLAHRRKKTDPDKLLGDFRLADHMDAIISLAVTRLVDVALGNETAPAKGDWRKLLKRMPRTRRVDLAVLAALYDQPRIGDRIDRWSRLARAMRLGWMSMDAVVRWVGGFSIAALVVLAMLLWLGGFTETTDKILLGAGAAGSGLLAIACSVMHIRLRLLAGRIRKELRVVDVSAADLRAGLGALTMREARSRPLPLPGDQDSRYQLINRLLGVLEQLGYVSLIVLVDRVDEPAVVNGETDRMKTLIWPLLNNKFLQQDRVAVKMMLPLELRHQLMREGPDFFQQARLDKQHLVDRLTWSGPLLYDLCSLRLQACSRADAPERTLTDLFEEDVSAQDLIDALDQMHQPRDAFKFLYRVIQEHCSNVPGDRPAWRIPRLTLEQVRKQQSQRVQELYRGLTPA